MAPRDTREALLDAGLTLMLEGGYDHAGTAAILERAGVPRGSFYHHFADKKAFAIEVARHYYDRHLPVLDRALSAGPRPHLERLRGYFEQLREHYRQSGWAQGCLLGLLGQELADRDPEARQALDALFRRWRYHLAACLREAQAAGELDPRLDPDELAGFLLDGWQGALLQMKIQKSGAPLDAFLRLIFGRLLAAR